MSRMFACCPSSRPSVLCFSSIYTNMRSVKEDNSTRLSNLWRSVIRHLYMLIIAMNHRKKNSKCTLMLESLFFSFFFVSRQMRRKKERNLNSYHRCFFLLFQLILYSIIIPTVCVYVYERRERTFRNSRSHDCLSRTIVVFPLVFRLNRFSLFFLFPTVHFPFRRRRRLF